MKNLIEQAVQWEAIGPYDKSEYRYEIDKAVIHKDTGVLSIDMTLNFIPPYLDMERLKAQIIHQLDKIKGVRFQYHFQNVILKTEDIFRLFIPHMIDIVNGEYASITKTIQTDNFVYDGNQLSIYALGKFSTEQLNTKVNQLFEKLLQDTFQIKTKVLFVNNERNIFCFKFSVIQRCIAAKKC